MSIELRERAIKAAKRYLEIQGLEVIDEAWRKDGPAGRIDPVAADEPVTVFASMTVSTAGGDPGFREEPLSREQTELMAAEQLGEHADDVEADMPVRFGKVAILICGEDRALLHRPVAKLRC